MPDPVTNCTLCPALVESRKCIVNGVGPDDAKIVFVGEGPAVEEDKRARPFVGPSGRVLSVLAWASEIDLHQARLTNATRCKPPYPRRNPSPDEIRACHGHLMDELQAIHPAVIVAMGKPALSSVYKPNVSVGDIAGFTVYNEEELPGIPIIPTYHPAYLMRNWSDTALVIAHLKKAKRIAEHGGLTYDMGAYSGITTLEDLRSLRDYLLADSTQTISLDTETTGLDWRKVEILCVSFSCEQGYGYSVPILHRGETTEYKPKKLSKKRAKELLGGAEPISPEEAMWAVQAAIAEQAGRDHELILQVPHGVYAPVPFWSWDDYPEVLDIIGEILSSPNPKVGQNVGFDARILERSVDEAIITADTAFGWNVENIQHDTKMVSSLLQENLPANLTVMTAYWTDIPYYESAVADFKKRMWEVPDDDLWEYGGADVDVPLRVLEMLHPQVVEEGSDWVYSNISIPLVRAALNMEARGVFIDRTYFDKLCVYYKDLVANTTQQFNTTLGREQSSPTYWENIQKVLFEELELPLTDTPMDSALESCKECKENRKPCQIRHAATGRKHLMELNERSPHPLLPILIELKRAEKFYSTYLEGGSGGYRQYIGTDNRIYAQWNAARAETGRFTCENPNLMNPPKEVVIHDDAYGIHSDDAIRSMFSAPKGKVVVNSDWSQLEVWVLAYETGDETLLNLLHNGEDVHVYVARKLCELGVSARFPQECWEPELDNYEWKKKYPELRGRAKTFTFGIAYQLTITGAADRLGCSKEEAEKLFDAFLNYVFPSLPAYFARAREFILRYNGIQNKFGRWRHFAEVPVLMALGQRWNQDLEGVIRQGINFPIQSGGHDLHSLAHIYTENHLVQRAAPVLEMHDSLMLEVDGAMVSETAWLIKSSWERLARDTVLRDGTKLGWEIPVEIKWGPSFGDPEFVLTPDGKILSIKEAA